MFQLSPLMMAGLTGFISGLLVAIPVGPVNLTILNEGARRGFRWAILIGLGATSMEVIYCTIAFTGFATLFGGGWIKASMELFSFVFMLYLGIRFLTARQLLPNSAIEVRLEEKWNPHSAFMVGFIRVLGNPGVLIFWIILAANFISREWVGANVSAKVACISGMAMATSLWFLGLSYAASQGKGRLSEKSLLRMEHFSGVILLLVALAHGVNIVWQMAQARN
jgi:threonine/homoserine/homoserine lactone efflux protein